MSNYWDDNLGKRIERAKIVHEKHPDGVTFLEHLRHTNPRLDYEVEI